MAIQNQVNQLERHIAELEKQVQARNIEIKSPIISISTSSGVDFHSFVDLLSKKLLSGLRKQVIVRN